MYRPRTTGALAALLWLALTAPVQPQEVRSRSDTTSVLGSLVAEALERSPRVAAARHEAVSLDARVVRAGAWEDPVLTLGFMNLRTSSFDFSDDFMTMKVVQLGQQVPLPGQIGHRRAAAALQAQAADHRVEAVRVEVASAVKEAYGELYYRDRALEIVERNLAILGGLEQVTRTRYATGVGRQPAVLRAGLEIDGLEAERVRLATGRRAALARLNTLRDRPAESPLEATPYPSSLLALVEGGVGELAFASALSIEGRVGADAEGTPGGSGTRSRLPPLDSLVALAVARKPELRSHVARIRAQEETVDLARALRWPAPRFGVGYGQREGRPDMLNATLSVSLPVFLGAKQGAAVREEEAALARERATHDRMVAEIEREVTEAYATVSDALGQLALYDRGILRRSEATLEATLAAYRSGEEDFLALLDSQSGLYRFRLERHRRLADLLSAWAALERAVGEEIEP